MRSIFMNGTFPPDILNPSLVLLTKCCTFCFFILSIFISSSVVFAAERFVPDQYSTIQNAINASFTGDTIYVDDGTYYENILFPPGKTITLISENGAVSTVIDGAHNGSVVTFAAGNNSTLDGFTIINGLTSESGGGVLIGSSSSPTIVNCIITNNEAFAGGGISCGFSSAPFITNSIIQNNSVIGNNDQSNGGGIHASTFSKPTITNCIIENNTSDRNGGGLAFNNADEPIIVNCIFSNNTAAVNGGAISFQNSAPIITNCTFNNNSALGNGGAIACSIPLSGTAVANSILWGDSPTEISCDLATISVTYSDIQGEITWPGTGNINADPMFVDRENGDFYLLEDSPCIDAGDNLALVLQATDIDGYDRKIDAPAVSDTGNGFPPIVDIGAFELDSNVDNVGNPTSGEGGGEGGGGGGIFGDIIKKNVLGYHLDGFTSNGVQIYMPVTPGFKALKGAQEYVRSFAPNLAEFVRKCFDFFERKADANRGGLLYKLGTHIFPVLGKIAEKSLEMLGEEKYIESAYSDMTISVEKFNELNRQGLAIAPKAVKERKVSSHEAILMEFAY